MRLAPFSVQKPPFIYTLYKWHLVSIQCVACKHIHGQAKTKCLTVETQFNVGVFRRDKTV